MGAPKPTLGFASRTQAVQALRGEGLSTVAIAQKIGIEAKTVVALETSAQRNARYVQEHRTVVFPMETIDNLRSPAEQRQIRVNELIRRIVDAVVDDGIIDAVLDDGGTK